MLCTSQSYRIAATAQTGACTLCPPNSASDSSRTFCRCDSGYYMVLDPASTRADHLLCQSCPLGADCTQTGTTIGNVLSLPSYWSEIENTNTSFIACINSGCVGGVQKCKANYTGNLCSQCAVGFTRDSSYECSACPSSQSTFWQILLIAGIVCLLCACIIFFTLSNTEFNIKKEARREREFNAALAERKSRRDAKLQSLVEKRALLQLKPSNMCAEDVEKVPKPVIQRSETLPLQIKQLDEEKDPEIARIQREFEREAAAARDEADSHQSIYPTFSILIKIFTSFLQFNSLASAFSFDWPDSVRECLFELPSLSILTSICCFFR